MCPVDFEAFKHETTTKHALASSFPPVGRWKCLNFLASTLLLPPRINMEAHRALQRIPLDVNLEERRSPEASKQALTGQLGLEHGEGNQSVCFDGLGILFCG